MVDIELLAMLQTDKLTLQLLHQQNRGASSGVRSGVDIDPPSMSAHGPGACSPGLSPCAGLFESSRLPRRARCFRRFRFGISDVLHKATLRV